MLVLLEEDLRLRSEVAVPSNNVVFNLALSLGEFLIEGTRPLLERVELDGETVRALCKRTKIVSLSEDSVLTTTTFDSVDSRVIASADVLRLLLDLDNVIII